MVDETTRAHLHSGCALLVGTVAADGLPHASRGWGLTVLCDDPLQVRLIVPDGDAITRRNLETTKVVAITTANVASLRSLQLKGTVDVVEPATDVDAAKAAQYRDDFFGDIVAVDHHPRELLDPWFPAGFVACVVTVREVFDQTPGPSAGGAFRTGSS